MSENTEYLRNFVFAAILQLEKGYLGWYKPNFTHECIILGEEFPEETVHPEPMYENHYYLIGVNNRHVAEETNSHCNSKLKKLHCFITENDVFGLKVSKSKFRFSVTCYKLPNWQELKQKNLEQWQQFLQY